MADTSDPPILVIVVLMVMYVFEIILYPPGGGLPISTYPQLLSIFGSGPIDLFAWFLQMAGFSLPGLPVPFGWMVSAAVLFCLGWIMLSILEKFRAVVGDSWISDLIMGFAFTALIAAAFGAFLL